jgi:hypothetical protein
MVKEVMKSLSEAERFSVKLAMAWTFASVFLTR